MFCAISKKTRNVFLEKNYVENTVLWLDSVSIIEPKLTFVPDSVKTLYTSYRRFRQFKKFDPKLTFDPDRDLSKLKGYTPKVNQLLL